LGPLKMNRWEKMRGFFYEYDAMFFPDDADHA